jgi:uncharacterized protein DUF642
MGRFVVLSVVAVLLTGCGGGAATQSALSPLSTQRTLAQRSHPFTPQANCAPVPGGSGILPDGDFSQAPDPPGFGQIGVPAGTVFAPQWVVTGQTIDFYGSQNPYWTFPNKLCNVDLDGTPGPGGITHSKFETKRGKAYTVSFVFSGNGTCGPTVKQMEVGVGTNQSKLFTWDISNGNDANHGHFAQATWGFEAHHRKTVLHFVSLDPPGNCGILIAGISVKRTR